MLFIAAATTAVRDLALPFPRPTPAQAVAQLAQAVERQADEPDDMIDAYGGRSEWLEGFEAEVAAHFGVEAGLYCPTGVAAQNSALAVHANLPFRQYRTQPAPTFVMHATSHLHLYEEKAYEDLLRVTALLAGDAGRVLAAKDIEYHLVRLSQVGSAPSMILVELPMRELGCATVPWEELLKIRRLADKYSVPLHLDGARLWEIAPYYEATAGVSVREIVALFDSAYVSFYKGLGALTGAMLLGTSSFIDAAKPWRRRLGANPYTVFPYALSCRDGFRQHAHTFASRWHKLRDLVPLLAQAARGEGGCLRTIPEVPQCSQVQCCIALQSTDDTSPCEDMAAMDAARDAVDSELGVRVYGRLVGPAPSGDQSAIEGEFFFEWSLGPAHVDVADEVFVAAWTSFFRKLKAASPA